MRPWKESVTDLYRKYRSDVFFATHVKIILFHVVSVAAIVLITVGLVAHIERVILTGIVDGFARAIAEGDSAADVFTDVNDDVAKAQTFIYAVVIAVSLFVGVVATQIALRPVRQSLITQRRFIGSVAHELRTPLAILKTQNEVARLETDPHSVVGETLKQNVEEIDHITEILNNLLLFNRVDTVESIVFDMVDLEAIVKTVTGRLERLAGKKGVTLNFACDHAIPQVYGNATGLEQAFFNLAKNGINYTKKGGVVSITCSAITERDVTLRVTDTGIGIEKKELSHVFEPFYRTHGGQEESAGTGLGLALVFEIVKLHNGRISIESTEGIGTCIDVTIPRQPLVRAPKDGRPSGVAYDFSKKE